MHLPMIGHVDWSSVAEMMKTENIVRYLSGLDPIETLTRPVSILVEVVFLCIVFFFGMIRTLAVVAGCIAIWCAIVYTLPDTTAEELSLGDLVNFLAILLSVVVVWVYVFFIREG